MQSNLTEAQLTASSPNLLAYIGDAVLELYIRERLVRRGTAQLAELHRTAAATVSAKGQFAAYNELKDMLSEEELAVMKRGRNTDSGAVPKNATPAQYRAATGVECLIGWLYFKGKTQRLNEILELCFSVNNEAGAE